MHSSHQPPTDSRRAYTDRYDPVPRRHLDIHPANQPLSLNPEALGPQHAPWLVGAPMIKSIERTFDIELNKLKGEMRSQQREFEMQLRQLRDEATRNIDYRYRAE